RARHLALVGRADHRARLADARLLRARAIHEARERATRVPGAHVAQPRRVVRPRVQSTGAARIGGSGRKSRRRLSHRAAQRDARMAGRALLPRAPRRGSRRARGARRSAARHLFRPQARAGQRGPRVRRARSHGVDATRVATLMSTTGLPHLYSGKVRELYEVGHDRLLMVASDRVSVFDVVLPDEIPDKARGLTDLSPY